MMKIYFSLPFLFGRILLETRQCGERYNKIPSMCNEWPKISANQIRILLRLRIYGGYAALCSRNLSETHEQENKYTRIYVPISKCLISDVNAINSDYTHVFFLTAFYGPNNLTFRAREN